jgi:UrcA family protein
MMKTLPALAALAVAGAFVAPTVSQAAEANSVRVSYADLNLASSGGQHVLQGRIAGAARVVCYVQEETHDLTLASATNACRSDAMAMAQPQYEAAVAAARHGTVTVLDGAALIVSAR